MGTKLLDLTSAEEASGRLGISRASLYAYVSRGLIRSFASPHDPRQKLYSLEDVTALAERKARFRRPAAAANPGQSDGERAKHAAPLLTGAAIC